MLTPGTLLCIASNVGVFGAFLKVRRLTRRSGQAKAFSAQ